jgi:Flp pilus assembly protein TadG
VSARRDQGRCQRRDHGSVTVEMVILTPILVALVLFVVMLGRSGGATEQVRHAADAGARAASIVSRSSMNDIARLVATADLAANGVNCASTSVSVGFTSAPSVSSVTVTVSCAVNSQGTSLLGASTRTVTASSTEIIDRYRSN